MRNIYCFQLFIFLISTSTNLFSQEHESDSTIYKNQTDLKDIFYRIAKKEHIHSFSENKKVLWSIYPAVGYSSNTNFAVMGGCNALFLLNHASKQSSLQTNLTYTYYKQTILPFQLNLWTKKDQFNFIFDSRYINFPSAAYGLNGVSQLNNNYTINFKWLKLHSIILKKIKPNLYAGAGLNLDYFWDIKEQNISTNNLLSGKINTAFEYYVKKSIPDSKETSFGPAFQILYDTRDNPLNAYKGIYVSGRVHPSFKGWGSDNHWANILIEIRKYFSLSTTKQNVIALWAYYWKNFGKGSYLLLPGTGWDDYWNTGRGYSQGRYRGKTLRYFETEYRVQFTDNGLLGGVLFANIQQYPHELNTSFSESGGKKAKNITALGAGIGLRIKLNKYSKTNLAFDLGFGKDFPHPWFSVNLGEVF